MHPGNGVKCMFSEVHTRRGLVEKWHIGRWWCKNLYLTLRKPSFKSHVLCSLAPKFEVWFKRLFLSMYKITQYMSRALRKCVLCHIQNAIGVHDDLTMVKKKKSQMVWPHPKILGHGKDNSAGNSERSKTLRKTEEAGRRNGREWGLDSLRAVEDREGWKGIVATSSVVPRWPSRLSDWEMRERDPLHQRWCSYIKGAEETSRGNVSSGNFEQVILKPA